MSKAAETTTLTLTNKQQLYKIIVDSRGNPDALAINLYWDEFRSWYNHKKIHTSSKIVKIPKLYKYGVYASYKELSKKYGVTTETIRKKIVRLEELELLSRDFYTNKESHKVLYNQLIIYIWQQTPYFFNPIGLDRTLIEELTPSTNHEYISSKYNNENNVVNAQKLDTPIQPALDTPSPSLLGHPLKKELDTLTPVQASSYIGLEEQGGIQAKLDTPPQLALDTNILREYNLYNVSIERLYSYSINNTHARGFNDKTIEEKKSGYADLAFGFLTEPTQSAYIDVGNNKLFDNIDYTNFSFYSSSNSSKKR